MKLTYEEELHVFLSQMKEVDTKWQTYMMKILVTDYERRCRHFEEQRGASANTHTSEEDIRRRSIDNRISEEDAKGDARINALWVSMERLFKGVQPLIFTIASKGSRMEAKITARLNSARERQCVLQTNMVVSILETIATEVMLAAVALPNNSLLSALQGLGFFIAVTPLNEQVKTLREASLTVHAMYWSVKTATDTLDEMVKVNIHRHAEQFFPHGCTLSKLLEYLHELLRHGFTQAQTLKTVQELLREISVRSKQMTSLVHEVNKATADKR